jgi:DNA-binding NtrC family response regulator
MSDDEGRTARLEPTGPAARDLLLAMWEDRAASVTLPDHGSVVVGRVAGAGLLVDHPSVSRQHARVTSDGGAITVEDLGSANGTRVDGRKLTPGEKARLAPGVVVEVGAAVLVLQRRASEAVAPPRGEATLDRHPLGIFVPADGPMAQVHRLLEHVAPSNLSVLILGETGAGKEVIAEAVHRFSKRAKGPFVRLNCAALTDSLLESELFGHEKGAFTGAIATKQGLVEAADGGTLFLDEMGEMPLGTQAKLLRVLERHEVQRVGSVKPRKVDLRVVAATNVDLEAAVRQGRFRLDLFHRLDGVSIAIPPLRARRSEILPLARRFLGRACEGRTPPVFSAAAERALESHTWPGNVRELRNVVERAAVLSAGGPIEPAHLRLGHGTDNAGPLDSGAPSPDRDEREHLLAVLERCGGNQSRAARELGIPRRTLLRRLDEYGVPRPRK